MAYCYIFYCLPEGCFTLAEAWICLCLQGSSFGRCCSRAASPCDANSGHGGEVPCLMPALSTPSPVATNTINCSQPMSHRAQSTGPDVHPVLLRVAVTVTRILSIIFGRLWQLVMGQICLEIVYRLIKDEGIWNRKD